MAQTGKQLRASLLTRAAQDYQNWERQRRFWQRVSITCAIIAVFFAGVAVGGAIS